MGFSVVSSVDRYVESKRKDRQPDGWWHPSSYSLCDRRATYDFRGTPQSNPPDERLYRVFEVGHEFHRFVQHAIAVDAEVLAFWPEVKAEHPILRIGGHTDGLVLLHGTYEDHDGLVTFSDDAVLEALELKSINSMAFKYKDLPKHDHVVQNFSYMESVRDYGGVIEDEDGQPIGRIEPLGNKLRRGRIVYVSKDDLQVEESIVYWTAAKSQELRAKLLGLRQFEDGDDLPPRLPDEIKTSGKSKGKVARAWQCGYCPFRDLCWGEES